MKGCYRLIGLILLLLTTSLIIDSSNALIVIPDKLRLNQHTGQPRACSVIGGALQVITRVALGGSTSPRKQFQIDVTADSNRAALQGNLKRVSIRVHNSKSLWLEVDRLDVEGSNLRLGWTPLIVSAALPLTLVLRPFRRVVWTLSVYNYMWTVIQKLIKRGTADNNNTDTTTSRNVKNKIQTQTSSAAIAVDRLKRRILGGAPSQLHYTVLLSNDNLSNSALLKRCSKFLLQSLMQNSMLQTAAVVGDAVNTERRMIQQQQQQQNTQTETNESGKLVIQQQQQQQQQQSQSNNNNNNNNQLSKLLSATSFELREAPTFRDGNYLQFVSQAVLPDDQARLDFVLRTKVRGGDINNNSDQLLQFIQPAAGDNVNKNKNPSCMLQFVQPECRFDVTEATSMLPLPKIMSNFLPKVLWLPVGSGTAIGGSSSSSSDNGGGGGGCHSIQKVQVQEGKCRIEGRLSFLQPPPPVPPSSGGLVRRR